METIFGIATANSRNNPQPGFQTGFGNIDAGIGPNRDAFNSRNFSSGVGSGFQTGISHHSSNNCPICQSPVWASGMVCDFCKSNPNRWMHLSLETLGINAFDLCRLNNIKADINNERNRWQSTTGDNVTTCSNTTVNRVVVRGFAGGI